MPKTKTKFDYEIEAFESAFKDKRQLKIAIYGTGRMTATLLNHLEGFQIIGLLDRDTDMIGKSMYGVKILSQQEAEKYADIIVINTSETYWNTIYKRISNWDIPIYFRNGDCAEEVLKHEKCDEPYWEKNYVELKKIVQNYEVVSFDIFDTLIMRKVYLPMDIFLLVEKRLRRDFEKRISFVGPRKKAASKLENATINEIYDELQKSENWDSKLTEKIKQIEIEVEKQLLIPRRDIVQLYNEIKSTKEVFFISDMYFPSRVLKELLKECGIIISEGHMIISCEHKKSKEEGSLWKYYADTKVLGKRALHIGDNERADGELAKLYDIDSYIIWSADKMLQKSSVGEIVPYVGSLYTSAVTGMLCAKLFNSPFALQKTSGKIYFENEQDAGYCLIGGIAHVFCDWLLREVKDNQVKQCAFFAREGYLLTEIFRTYCQLKNEKDIPEIIYMEASRRAVLTASIKDRSDIYEVADFPYVGSIKDFLYDRFGVCIENKDQYETRNIDVRNNKKVIEDVLKQYEKEILEESSRERRNYITYLKSIGLNSDFTVIDSQLYGTTQYYLGKMLGKELDGYYFCVCLDGTNKYLQRNIMKGCFPGRQELDGKDSSIYKNAAFIESFFTAPNGMLECIEEDGRKRYAGIKQNQRTFNIRLDMLEGIYECLKDIIDFCSLYDIDINPEDIYFMDKLYGIFMNNGFEPTDKMKASFFYDNGIAGHKEIPIWE